MKKIFFVLMFALLFFLTASCTPTIDSKYWGSSYGYSEVIDGLEVCLRTDGYYQVVGIRKQAIKDGTLIIPQYINGIPVMGLGANFKNYDGLDLFTNKLFINPLADFLRSNGSLELETSQSYTKYYFNPSGSSAYCTKDDKSTLTKVILSCHHMNYSFDWIFPTASILIYNTGYEFMNDNLDYYIEYYKDYFKGTVSDEWFLWEVLERTRDAKKGTKNCFFDSKSYLNRKKVYDDCIIELSKQEQELAISEYNELREQYGDEYDWDWYFEKLCSYEVRISSKRKMNYSQYTGDSIETEEFTEYLGELIRKKYPFIIDSANVEFYYNTIDGEEYHSWLYPNGNVYMIDYLEDGQKLEEPPVPYVKNHQFLGWYIDEECTELYDFNKPVNKIEDELVWLKLYAKWQ